MAVDAYRLPRWITGPTREGSRRRGVLAREATASPSSERTDLMDHPNRSRTLRRGAAAASAATLAAVLLLPGVGADASSSLKVKLSDFKVTPSSKSVSHGKVTFRVTNAASMEHELMVIKTTKKAAKLKIVDGKASEKGSVGEVELAEHKSKNLSLNLKKGHYALICNVGGHYMAGMHADLTVK
jgi:uncharacterized cupredoxin-like copper-binding protein